MPPAPQPPKHQPPKHQPPPPTTSPPTTSPPTVVIAAGGTGGHIYPGLALADAVRRADPRASILFVGTPRGLERRLIPEAGYDLRLVGMVPFSGRDRFVAPLAFVRAAWQCRRLLRAEGASVAVGMGGYAGIPLMAAARFAGVPALIHESGAVAGRANRLAARFTGNVALAFADAASSVPARTHRVVGMPLGGAITAFDRGALRPEARAVYGLDDGTAMVLVVGGSQGSVRLNGLAVALAERWRDRDDVRIVLKTGRDHLAGVTAAVERAGVGGLVHATEYLDRIDHAYAAADVGIFRAGAATVAELAIVGLPSVLVPYPYAPDDHQAVNAGVLVSAGAAVLVRDHEAHADRVGAVIEGWLADRAALARMGAAARAQARPRAADDLAAWALELAGARPSPPAVGG